MAAPRWSNSKDGVMRANIRIEYRLSADDMTELLCAYASIVGCDDMADFPASRTEEYIRRQLSESRRDAYYWHEGVDEKEVASLREWASRQVAVCAPRAHGYQA